MQSFEIRVLRTGGTPALIAEQSYLNADAAITAARLIARGRPFEVWGDDDCVYSESSRSPSRQPPPRPAA